MGELFNLDYKNSTLREKRGNAYEVKQGYCKLGNTGGNGRGGWA